MLFCALLRFFAKREGKIPSNFDKQKLFHLAPHSASSCSSCTANCIRRFLITQFLATEAFGQEYPCGQEIVRRQLSSICVSTFTNVLALHFKVKFDQLFVQRVLRSRLTSNLQI